MASISFPSSPSNGDTYTYNGVTYEYNSAKSQWIVQTGTSLANVNINAIGGDMVPAANVTYDLGSATNAWKDLHLAGNTIFLGAGQISTTDNGSVVLPAGSRVGATAIGTGASEVIDTTLTKTFTANEEYTVTLSNEIAISPIVSATKEVAPSDVSTKGAWDVNSTASNYDLHNTAYDTTLRFGTLTYDMSVSLDNTVIYPYTDFTASAGIVGIEFNYNGTKLYVMQSYYVHQYTLSTAYDISTATDDGVPFNMQTNATYETTPLSFKFKPDGTRFYMTGDRFDRVYQFDLSTAWDLSTASYGTDQYLGLGRQKYFVEFNDDGTQMYGYDYLYGTVKRYNLSTAWDVTTGVLEEGNVFTFAHNQTVNDPNAHYNNTGIQAREMRFNESGTKLLVMAGTGTTRNSSYSYIDFWNGFFHEYSLSTPYDISTATYVRKSFDPKQDNGVGQDSRSVPGDQITGFVYNDAGDKIYAVMTGYINEILEFQLGNVKQVGLLGSGSLDSADVGKRIIAGGGEAVITSAFGEYSEVSTIPDVTYTSGQWEMYALDVDATNGITTNSTQVNPDAWDISAAVYEKYITIPAGSEDVFFKPDGTKMYISFPSGINEYDLSTAWDVGTFTLVQSFSTATEETSGKGTFFKPDGTKMYFIGSGGDNIYEYNLSTAWDISTATFVQSFSVVSQESTPNGIYFKSDGTEVYIIGQASDSVHKYSLSTAWDISTATFVQSFSVATEGPFPHDVFFKTDGTKMYIIGYDDDEINEYSLSTAWDISTAIYSQTLSTVGRESTPNGIFFDIYGTRMYISGRGSNRVVQYSIGTATVLTPSNYSSAITNNSGQISTITWDDINSMSADQVVSGNSEIYYAISSDNKQSFKIVNATLGERTIAQLNGSWEYNSNTVYASNTWTTATSNNVHVALQEAIENNSTNRMDATQLGNVGDDYHIVLGDTLDLGIIMKSDGNNLPTSDGVSINYTGQLYNVGAIHGTDYTYVHNSNTQVTITALNAGNYKFRIV